MKVNVGTWRSFVTRYGEFDARRRLRYAARGKHFVSGNGLFRANRDPFALITELIHHWPGQAPSQRRKKFADAIRAILRTVRQQRERINGFCATGISLQRLP